jgi:autophagy-related protein 18
VPVTAQPGASSSTRWHLTAAMIQPSDEGAANAQQQESVKETQTQTVVEHISGLNFANFNQDYTCISVGYNNGFRIYNCEPFTQCYEQIDGSIGIVEMLFFSSLLAVVGTGENPALSPRRLRIINTKRHTTICELTFPTSILAVRMNRHRLIVMLEELIYIYDITNMRLLHTVEIPSNPTGLVALSINTDNNYLAYPSPKKVTRIGAGNDSNTSFLGAGIDAAGNNGQHSSGNGGAAENGLQDLNISSARGARQDDLSLGLGGVTTGIGTGENGHTTQNIRNGDIIIFDCKSLQPITVIDAHKTELAAMAFSHDGTLLATASDKGTVIRVFSVETGLKLYQFRRGTYNTKIYSLAFSPSNMFLVASSATGTVHVFRLGEEEAKNTIVRSNGSSGWLVQKKNATDRNIEATRQEELNKLMRYRQAKLEALDGEDNDQYHDQMHEYINSQNNRCERSQSSEGNPTSIHFDSEEDDDEAEGLLEDDDISDDGDIDAGEEDAEVDDYENVDVLQPLRSELESKDNTSKGSGTGVISICSNSSGDSNVSKVQPIVDSKRRSVARMLRRTSQSLGRKAAEKMGTYLPPRFSSILEPNRHFASFKLPGNKESMSLVGVIEGAVDNFLDVADDRSFAEPTAIGEDGVSIHSTPSGSSSVGASVRHTSAAPVHILVVSAEGVFYTYRLDPLRGGDCMLLAQRSLQE